MLYFFGENINRASVERYCWHVNAPSDASSRRSRSFFINRKSATILHIFKRALALQHGGNMRRNQIGSACAGSNPAVRALNKSGRARVVKGFDSNRRITTRRCVLLCVILSIVCFKSHFLTSPPIRPVASLQVFREIYHFL